MQSSFVLAACASDLVTGLSVIAGRSDVMRLGGFFLSFGDFALVDVVLHWHRREGRVYGGGLQESKTAEGGAVGALGRVSIRKGRIESPTGPAHHPHSCGNATP